MAGVGVAGIGHGLLQIGLGQRKRIHGRLRAKENARSQCLAPGVFRVLVDYSYHKPDNGKRNLFF
ncbi:protein of unknown function [Magnetospirillum sp. XM-1]|nr:protein of unknown function [Magnetospirillum sp. XM-1]